MKKLLLLLSLLPLCVCAQTLEEELNDVSARIDSCSMALLEVEISIFTGKGGTVVKKTTASVSRAHNRTLTVIDGVEVYSDGKYFAAVDHESKTVNIVSSSKTKVKNAFDNVNTDKLVKWIRQQQKANAYNVRKNGESDGLRSYTATGSDGTEMTVILNVLEKSLKKIVISYGKGSPQKDTYVEMNYTKFLINDPSIRIDQEQFFVRKADKFELGHRLKDYKLTTIL